VTSDGTAAATRAEPRPRPAARNRTADVLALIRPGGIAVIGAAARPGRMGGHIWLSLEKFDPPVPRYAISSRRDPAFGDRWLPGIEDVPAGVDQAVLCAPAGAVAGLVRRCSAAGIRTVVVYASGFGEIGTAEGHAFEADLRQAIAETQLTVLGPNCVGYFAVQSNGDLLLPTAFSVLDPEPPEVVPIAPKKMALISQSGGIGSMVVGHLRNMGVWPWCYVSTGNEYDLTIWDAAAGLGSDPGTQVLGLYLEGLQGTRDLARTVSQLRAAGKKVVVLLGGRTAEGSRSVTSHTGRIAQDGSLYPAYLEQHGISLARDPWELAVLMERAATLPDPGPLRDCAIITASGGMGTITSDLLADSGVALPELGEEAGSAIRAVLPAFASRGDNPVDVGGGSMREPETLGRVAAAVRAAGKVDFIVMTNGGMAASGVPIARGMVDALVTAGLPAFVFWPHCGSVAQKTLWSQGVPCVTEGGELVRLIELTRELGRARRDDTHAGRPTAGTAAATEAARLLRDLHARGTSGPEVSAKAVLARLGLAVPASALITLESEVDNALGATGLPAVAKGQSPRVTHKQEAGLVRTSLQTAGEVSCAVRELADRLRVLGGPGEVLVEAQVPARLELLAGWTHTSMGLVFVFGFGGIRAETIADSTVMFPPLTENFFRDAMLRTVAGRVLAYQFPSAAAKVAQFFELLAALAAETADLGLDLDVNPLAVTPAGELVVLDAAFSPAGVSEPPGLEL
jgi:acetate---CoA ligase (ADP-forming)